MAFLNIFGKKKLDLNNINSPEDLDEFISLEPENSSLLIKNKNLLGEMFKSKDGRNYMKVFEKFAERGSLDCQVLVTQMTMIGIDRIEDVNRKKLTLIKGIKFGELAASNGSTRELKNIPISIHKLVKILFDENNRRLNIVTVDYINQAYRWHITASNSPLLSEHEKNSSKDMAKKMLIDFENVIDNP